MIDTAFNQVPALEAGKIAQWRHRKGAKGRGKPALPGVAILCLLALVLAPHGSVWGQEHQVSGTVTSTTQQPLSAVSVGVKGSETGTLTNTAGEFTVLAASPGDTLVITTVGYQRQEVPVEGRNTIDVVLATGVIDLEGLVVVGYGTAQTRASVSGSVAMVQSEDLVRTSGTVTTEALVGKMPGVTTRVTAGELGDARPGASNTVQIRNLGLPLVVIDGVPQEYVPGRYDSSGESVINPLDMINPADIESISVLKDAAASVYGFRAANGVVLVTTKQGRAEAQPRVNVDGYYGVQNIVRFPYREMANAYEFQRAWVQSEQNRQQPRSISAEDLEKWRLGTEPGFESYDQYPVVINNPNAAQYNINASISGAAAGTTYYFSTGHVSQDYVMRGHNFNRTNFQANLRSQLRDHLAVGLQVSGGLENRDNVAIPGREDVVYNAMLGINSSYPMDNPWANSNRDFVNGDVRFLVRLGSTYDRDIAGWQEDIRRNLTANFFTEYTLPFGMEVRGTYSHTFRLNTFERHRYNYDAYCYDGSTDTYDVCAGFYGAQRDKERREIQQQFVQLQLNHTERFGAHTISGVAAIEATGNESNFVALQAVPSTNSNRLIDFVNMTSMDNSWSAAARQSLIGGFNYDYDDRYMVEARARYDGSHLYAPGRRWGFFPGVSVAWRPTQEAFLSERLDFLDDLKFRMSWGQSGREQGVQPWGFLGGATYGIGGGYMFDGTVVTGVRPRGLPVTNLSWVTATARNVGVDLVMMNQRLSVELDVFERRLTGLPAARYDVLLPSEVGYSLPNENLESEANRGFEAMVTYADAVGSVAFSVSPHVTVARQRILDRYRPRYGNSWDRYRTATEDRWAGTDFGYQVVGQFQSVEEIENHTVDIDGQGNRTLLPGDLIFLDVNGDGLIDPLDQRPIGYTVSGNPNVLQNPIIMFGLNHRLDYRGASLSMDWSGGSMFSYHRAVESRIPFQGNHNSQRWFLTDVWHRADPYDDQSEWIPGTYPAIRRGLSNHVNLAGNRGGNSDYWRRNVHYLRLKRVELSYDLPQGVISGMGLDRFRVYTSVANPFSIDNVRDVHMDPEILQASGLRYPTQRVFNVGFSTTF